MKINWGKSVKTVLAVLAGNVILAFTVAAFMVPSGIVMGGATGIGLVLTHYFPMNLSVVIFGVNVVLFILGAAVLGKRFAFTTIISTFAYPIFLSMIQSIPGIDSLTDNTLLATIYGGVVLGIGVGMIVRVGSSTGGTDIMALVCHKWFHLPVAVLIYLLDFTVLGFQIMFSDSEQVLYGVLALILETYILNRVMLLGRSQIQLFIISEQYDKIKEDVLKVIGAGATMVHIETGYASEQQKGVLCIIPNRKLYAMKELVQKIDPKAFITITQINEVSGRGFTIARLERS